MSGPRNSAERATPAELRQSIMDLLAMFVVLALLVVPVIRSLPLGQTTRTGILAWLLVALSLYWLYAGHGYRPFLILQLALFSIAAALLITKLGLVFVGTNRLSILRRTAKALIVAGALTGVINLSLMLLALIRRSTGPKGK
jgi:hypothetical protein